MIFMMEQTIAVCDEIILRFCDSKNELVRKAKILDESTEALIRNLQKEAETHSNPLFQVSFV